MSNNSIEKKSFYGIKVISIDEIDRSSDDLVIVAADGKNAEEMLDALKQNKYDNYCSIGSCDIPIICELKRMNCSKRE